MQLQFRIDDTNYITVEFQLQSTGADSSSDRPQIIAATVTDTKLSQLKTDDILDLAAQIVDYFSVAPQADKPAGDWFTNDWLPLCK